MDLFYLLDTLYSGGGSDGNLGAFCANDVGRLGSQNPGCFRLILLYCYFDSFLDDGLKDIT